MQSRVGEEWKINHWHPKFNLGYLLVFLSKPYSQRATLKCLTDAIGCIIPEIHDATYSAQLHSCLSRPPELEPMLAICRLKSEGEHPKR